MSEEPQDSVQTLGTSFDSCSSADGDWYSAIPFMEGALKRAVALYAREKWRIIIPSDEANPWSRIVTNGIVKFAIHAGECIHHSAASLDSLIRERMTNTPAKRRYNVRKR